MTRAMAAAWARRVTTGAALAGVIAAALVPGRVIAQDEQIEEIVVTGSRIARPDFESASPVVTIANDTLTRTGDPSVESVIGKLPQFTPTYTSTSNNPGNGGQGNVQLRGLGLTSTLVLLDGRRLIPGNGNGVVDVNVIPQSLVESVEVMSGGASAVYGSDAIAGVVNFKLKHEFHGLQFDGGWGQTGQGDATQYNAGLTGGLSFADGRGDAFAYFGYAKRDAVFQRARKFSEVSLGYFGPGNGTYGPDEGFLPQGSPTIAEGRTGPNLRPSQEAVDAVFGSYGYAPGTVPASRMPFGFNSDGTLFSVGLGRPGAGVVNFRGEKDPLLWNDLRYSYNYGPWNYLQLPLEQYSSFGRASYKLDSGVEMYAQVLYSDYSADTQLAPAPAMNIHVPVTNPYIPADLKVLLDSRANPTADLIVQKRLSELGPRIASYQHDVLQATAGLHGEAFDGWRYDAYVQVGSYDQTEQQHGNALRSKMEELTFAPDGGQAACGGFNLFGLGSISPQCAKYIEAGGTNRSGFDQTIAEVSMTGAAMTLPAGDLHLAVGAMYKHDKYFYKADPIGSVVLADGQVDIQGFDASDDITGSDHNTDVYVEALIPLLADAPGVERLEAGLGYRRSDYASAGPADAYKAELLYQPVSSLKLRSSYQRAVRAPSVYELYLPHLPLEYLVDFDLSDPCSTGSAQRSGPNAARVEQLCRAQGVPPAVLPNFQDGDGVIPGHYGGNPDLNPEKADTLTAGIVVQSRSTNRWLSSMQVSLDWYRVKVDNAIVQVYAYDYVPLCYDPRTNPNFDPNNRLCSYFTRDPATGEISDVRDYYQNIVGYTVSGIDTQLDWKFAVGPGDVGVNWLISWMDQYETTKFRGLPAQENVGLVGQGIGATFPEWKSTLTLTYAWRGLTAGTQWRYIDAMHDHFVDNSIDVNYPVPSYSYYSLFGSYAFDDGFLKGLTLNAGVENLTDKNPPLLPDAVAANTDPSQYDVLGRRFYVRLSYRF